MEHGIDLVTSTRLSEFTSESGSFFVDGNGHLIRYANPHPMGTLSFYRCFYDFIIPEGVCILTDEIFQDIHSKA